MPYIVLVFEEVVQLLVGKLIHPSTFLTHHQIVPESYPSVNYIRPDPLGVETHITVEGIRQLHFPLNPISAVSP